MSEWKHPAGGPVQTRPLTEGTDTRPKRRWRNWIARHWRGDLPLWVSYWVISLITNLATPVIAAGISLLMRSGTYEPLRSFAAIVTIWIIAVVVTTWQLGGLWRSARRYRVDKARDGKWGVWGIAAQISVVVGVIATGFAFVREGVPQLVEVYAIAFRGDPDIPDYTIRVMRDGTEAEIAGGFKYGLTEDFGKVLAASPRIGVVHLDSLGGRIGEGQSLYRLIRQHGLTTYVRANCMSACTLAFAAGRERYIAQGATLGFHRGAFPGTDEGAQDHAQRMIFTEAGFAPAFIDTALSTPHRSMFKPSADVLLDAHVITAVASEDRFAYSGMGTDFSAATIAAILGNVPTLAAIRDRYSDQFEALVNDYRAAITSGKTEAETIAILRAKIGPFIKSRLPEADDDVVIESYQLMTDELKALRGKNPAWCYGLALHGDKTFHREIPTALLERESRNQERVIRTATKRAPVDADAANASIDKIFDRMRQSGTTDDDVTLLASDEVEASQQPRYCDLTISFHEELEKLPRDEAILAMRFLMEAK